jgi:hypothetical protein
VTDEELDLRLRIMRAFAATGEPPDVSGEDPALLRSLVDRHLLQLDERGAIRAAFPFAAHDEGARVESGGRVWRGNCPWDAFGIAAALGLRTYDVIDVSGLNARDASVFHTAVSAAHWWDDIAFT